MKKEQDPRQNLTRENIVVILACLQPYTRYVSVEYTGDYSPSS